jgi:hypothetical protein
VGLGLTGVKEGEELIVIVRLALGNDLLTLILLVIVKLSLGVLETLIVLLPVIDTELLIVTLGVHGVQYSHPSLGLTLGI